MKTTGPGCVCYPQSYRSEFAEMAGVMNMKMNMKKNRRADNNSQSRIKKQTRITVKNKRAPKKKRVDYLKVVCWIIVPIIVTALVVLDALGVYTFNTQRLMVLGIGLLIILLPFFSEITVKDLSVKRSKAKDHT